MINLNNSHITAILPEALASDPKTKALSYALNKAMQRLLGYCQNIGVYNAIDTLPEQILDLLAVELNTQYYDDSLNIKVKRSLVKNTLVWYMNTGTHAAVTELVKAVFGDGDIEEWFEYDGEPYHFKIYTSNINTTDEMIQQVTDLVGRIQNVRSHLEEVVVDVMQKLQIFHGCVVESVSDSTTIGIDMNISTMANQIILLVDAETKIVYEVAVIDGELTMEETIRTTEYQKDSILFLDAKTKSVYEVKVVGGKLTMGEVETASDEAEGCVLLADIKAETVHALSVYDGKLTMN